MVEGGRTPILPAQQLQAAGFSMAIFPNSLTRLLGKVGALLLNELKDTGTTAGMAGSMLDHTGLWDLFDNKRWRALEDRYGAEAPEDIS
jgi:2-methylisocitrate lyase-like PEP mutase family enzyme